MSHILVVEDDLDIAALLAHYLEKAGHRVERITSGTEVLPKLRKGGADLVILDLMLPGMDGLVVCQAMGVDPAIASIPIIMLTARSEESNRISGLELGADDYVTKPFSPKEVVARVTALLRRAGRTATAGPQHYGRITIDADRHTVALDGEDVKLTAKEFLLLQYLLEHKGRVLSRDLLLSDVWGYHYTGGTRTVDVHIRRLREKLPPLGEHRDHQAVRLQARRTAVTFRTRLFLTSLVTAAVTLVVATVLVSWSVRRATDERIERSLVSQTRQGRNPCRP